MEYNIEDTCLLLSLLLIEVEEIMWMNWIKNIGSGADTTLFIHNCVHGDNSVSKVLTNGNIYYKINLIGKDIIKY